jgi:ribonuclease PH
MTPISDAPTRAAGRRLDSLRPVTIELDPLKFADGSALITCGDTRVIAAATLEGRVPPFLSGSGSGWLTAEYAMLPRATPTRSRREVTRGRPSGRSSEIQRLIGRSLRAALDLPALGEKTLILDCDVLQADGGTRTASITGAWVAAVRALARALLAGDIERWPVAEQVAAVSVGVVGGVAMLDLDAPEDQSADVDMNVIATAGGRFVEIQGTAERQLFTRADNDALLDLALAGISELCRLQSEALEEALAEVAAVSGRTRRKAPPKDEASVWGRPGSS